MNTIWRRDIIYYSFLRIFFNCIFSHDLGKSLDKCVEIREMAGLHSVEDRFTSEQKKEQRRAENIERNQQSPETSVFAFLNKNISRGNGE